MLLFIYIFALIGMNLFGGNIQNPAYLN